MAQKEGEYPMKLKCLILVMMLSLLAGGALAQQVSVNYNHNASFANYHTYAWGTNNKNEIQNSILAQVAQQDIDNAMVAKGFQKVTEAQNPDLILTASGGEREQTSYNAWGMRGIGGGMGGITPQQNVEATMVVSLYDLKAKELVWRGIAQDTLGNNGNKNQEMVNKAVQKMFKQWPKS
jgi:NADPH:quinone reductase-like Zn-dependent oxidoreductase